MTYTGLPGVPAERVLIPNGKFVLVPKMTLLVGTGPWPVVAGVVFGGLFASPLPPCSAANSRPVHYY